MHHVKNTLQLRDLNSGQELHSFPMDIGSVTGFSGDIRHKEMFFKFSSQVSTTWSLLVLLKHKSFRSPEPPESPECSDLLRPDHPWHNISC